MSTMHRGDALPSAGVEHARADVLSEVARSAAGRAEAVVHLAGQGDVRASFDRPYEYNRLNALGTLNILEGARKSGAHVVLASTQRVYQASEVPLREDAPMGPADPYAVSKLVAERWCLMYAELLGVPTTVVRLFSVYGPGQVGQGTSGVVGIFIGRALRGQPLEVHAAQRRDLTYVGDVARGIRLAIERPSGRSSGRVLNLATGVGTSLEELAHLVRRVTESGSAIVPSAEPSPEGDRVADLRRARAALGYEPEVGVEDGVRRMAAWARETGGTPP